MKRMIALIVVAAVAAAGCELANEDGTCNEPANDRIIDYTHGDVIITCWYDFDGDPTYPVVVPLGSPPTYPVVVP